MDFFFKILTWSNMAKPKPGFGHQDILLWDLPASKNVKTYTLAPNCRHAYTGKLFSLFTRAIRWFIPVTRNDKEWRASSCKSAHEVAVETVRKTFDVQKDPVVSEYYQESKNFADLRYPERLEWVCTRGIGAHLIRAPPDKRSAMNVIDLRYLSEYPVRKGYERYGAALYLNGLTPDYIVYKDRRLSLEQGYPVFMASLLVHVTIVNHAVETHFMRAGRMNTRFLQNWEKLPEDLVDFLKVFLFQTSAVNGRAISILLRKGGILSRLFAFTEEGLAKLFADSFLTYSHTSSDSLFPLDGTTVKADAERYRECVREFVTACVETMFPEEVPPEVVDFIHPPTGGCPRDHLSFVLAEHIFFSTLWHELVGHMGVYVFDPRAAPTKIREEFGNTAHTPLQTCLQTQQDTYQASFLALLTSATRMPSMLDDLYRTQGFKYAAIWSQFQTDLKSCPIECWGLEPVRMESSVSL